MWCSQLVNKPPTSIPPTTSDPLQVSLILGSYTYEPVVIDLFDLTLPPSHPAPQHPEEESYHPRPEIFHTFRPDPKSPNKIISAVFSGLVLAPWVVLIGLVRSCTSSIHSRCLTRHCLTVVFNTSQVASPVLTQHFALRSAPCRI